MSSHAIVAFDLLTSEPLGRLEASDIHWTEGLNAALTLDFRLDLADPPSREMAQNLVTPGVGVNPIHLVLYDPPIAKSFILLDATYEQRRFLRLRAAGKWAWFRKFPLTPPFTYIYSQWDQLDIARSLLFYAHIEADDRRVRINYDLTDSGVLRDRTYHAYEWETVGVRIEQLAAVENGFDFDIVTTFDGNVTVIDTWTPYYPRAGRTWPDSGIQIDADTEGIDVRTSWAYPTTDAAELGAGEGDTMLVATHNDPSLDVYAPNWFINASGRRTVSGASTLKDHAMRDLELENRKAEAWQATVLDVNATLKGLTVGDECQVVIGPGDYMYPDGTSAVRRITGRDVTVDDDGGPDTVRLTLEASDLGGS